MGIKSLSKFLKDNYGIIFKQVSLSDYRFKKFAIDVSLYLCQFKARDDNKWHTPFVNLVSCLRANEIHCVFIYDTGHPPEKTEEKKTRSENRQKLRERVEAVEEALDKYITDGEVSDILLEFQEKRGIKPMSLGNKQLINVKGIEFFIQKMKRQLFTVTPQDIEESKKILTILDVPFFNAPLEAETTCADLCIQGKVDAVLSEDTDVLAYGAPLFLSKIDTRSNTCLQIEYSDMLKEMDMNTDQFLDFCIMCGTDYNKNIHKIGPKKAESMIKKYGSIEGVKESGIDTTILNHNRVRQLFRDYKRSDFKVTYCGIPKFGELEEFLFKKNQRVNLDALKKSFTHNIIIFEEE
jgi:5'-3' exonuclease